MRNDFEIINPPKVPYWRDPKRRPRAVGAERFVLVGLSLFCVVLMLAPPPNGYSEPISFQLSSGYTPAWILFGGLGLMLIYLMVKFGSVERYMSALFCLLAGLSLAAIAVTNPLSMGHLNVFMTLCGMVLVWLWGVQLDSPDFKLFLSATICTLGVFYCLENIGVGERVILISSLAGINALFYEQVLV